MTEADIKSKTFARTPSSWDPQDDLLLRRLKEQQKLGWKEISSHFNNRTPNACQFRWRRLRSGSLKSSSTASLPQQGVEEQKLQIQPKTIRRHSLLSTSSVSSSTNNTPMISSNSRSGSFTDLQSTNSISSGEISSNLKQRSRSYSSSLVFHHDDPLYQQQQQQHHHHHHYTSLPQQHLSNNLNNHLLNPHHLIQKQHHQQHPQHLSWEEDEDDLLLNRRERELSFTELSILLPSKSEMDIWLRIEYLETNRKNSLPQLSRSLSISSSISNQSLVYQSRENSISIPSSTSTSNNHNNNNHNNNDLIPKQATHQLGQFLLPSTKEEKEFTKKRSIKLPSLGSILNNF